MHKDITVRFKHAQNPVKPHFKNNINGTGKRNPIALNKMELPIDLILQKGGGNVANMRGCSH